MPWNNTKQARRIGKGSSRYPPIGQASPRMECTDGVRTAHPPRHVDLHFTSLEHIISSHYINQFYLLFTNTHLSLLHLSIIKQQKWLQVQPILTVTLLTRKLLASLPTRVTQLIVSCRPVRDSKLTTMLFLSPLHDLFSLYGSSYGSFS
jgi:hypothetical protein